MPSLPVVGSDSNQWGQKLNDFLSVAHAADGNIKSGYITAAMLGPDAVAWKDIRNYGASTSASASTNTAAIQAAVDALYSTGGIVYVPAGIYNVNNSINVKGDGIFIVGDWMMQSIFSGSLGKGSVLRCSVSGSITGAMIEFATDRTPGVAGNYLKGGGAANLTLDCNGNGLATGANLGIRIRAAFQQMFHNVHISEAEIACWDLNDYNESVGWSTQNNAWGARLWNCSAFTFSNPAICLRAGTNTTVQTFSGATQCYFYNFFATVNDGVCVDLNTCDDMYFYGGQFNVSGTGTAVEFRGRNPASGWQKAATDCLISGVYTSGTINARKGDGTQPSYRNTLHAINYSHDSGDDEVINVEDGAHLSWINNNGITRGWKPEHRNEMPTIVDDFVPGLASAGNIGALGWNANGTISTRAAEADHTGIYRVDTGASAGTVAYICIGSNGTGNIWADDYWETLFVVRLNNNDTDTQVRIGLGASASGDPVANGVYFEKLYADTSWFFVTRASGVQTRTSAGSVSTNWLTLKFRRYSPTQALFTFDNGTATFQSANVPTGLALQPVVQIKNQTASSKTIDIDYFNLYVEGLAR